MPKSPRENSSGEAVSGGRERSSHERYYRSLEMKEIGVGKGESGESENWKCSHLTAQDAVFLQRKAQLIDQLNYQYIMEALARRQDLS